MLSNAIVVVHVVDQILIEVGGKAWSGHSVRPQEAAVYRVD